MMCIVPKTVARARSRAADGRQVEQYLELLAGLTPSADTAGDRRRACLALSAMVGAIVMARAVGDAGLSDDILSGTAAALKDFWSRRPRHRKPARWYPVRAS